MWPKSIGELLAPGADLRYDFFKKTKYGPFHWSCSSTVSMQCIQTIEYIFKPTMFIVTLLPGRFLYTNQRRTYWAEAQRTVVSNRGEEQWGFSLSQEDSSYEFGSLTCMRGVASCYLAIQSIQRSQQPTDSLLGAETYWFVLLFTSSVWIISTRVIAGHILTHLWAFWGTIHAWDASVEFIHMFG